MAVKLSNTSGTVATISTLDPGDIGINLSDGKMFVTDGITVYEIGANLSGNSTIGGNITVGNSTVNTFITSSNLTTTDILAETLEITDIAIINTNSITVGNSSVNTIISAGSLDIGGDIVANGSVGSAGLVLKSGGVGANSYWSEIATSGTATLVAGSVIVSSSLVSSTTKIFLTVQSLGTVTTPKTVAVTSRVNGTSFTITSEDNTDTSVIAWMFIQP